MGGQVLRGLAFDQLGVDLGQLQRHERSFEQGIGLLLAAVELRSLRRQTSGFFGIGQREAGLGARHAMIVGGAEAQAERAARRLQSRGRPLHGEALRSREASRPRFPCEHAPAFPAAVRESLRSFRREPCRRSRGLRRSASAPHCGQLRAACDALPAVRRRLRDLPLLRQSLPPTPSLALRQRR